MNLENRHLVAIDASSTEPRVLVVRPPQALGKDDALAFAAHLIATANTATAAAGKLVATPLDFARMTKMQTKAGAKPLVDWPGALRGTFGDGGSLPAAAALELAAGIVASADPDANMLELVNGVVEAARGGRALEATLRKEGVEVKLGAPMRTRLDASTMTEADELEAEEASEAMLKKMRR